MDCFIRFLLQFLNNFNNLKMQTIAATSDSAANNDTAMRSLQPVFNDIIALWADKYN